MPKRGADCKAVLEKRDEMVRKQMCNSCQKGGRVAIYKTLKEV